VASVSRGSAHLVSGEHLAAAADADSALKCLDALEREFGRLPDPWSEVCIAGLELLGRALQQRGDFKAARDALVRALDIRPGNPKVHAALAEVLEALGDEPAAISELRVAIQQDGELTDARLHLARLLGRQGNLSEALDHLDVLVSIQPSGIDARLLRAETERALSRYDLAVADLCEAATLQSDGQALDLLSDVVRDAAATPDQLDTVLDQIERLQWTQAGLVKLRRVLAEGYTLAGRLQAALEMFNSYLDERGEDLDAALERVEVLTDLGRAEEALQACAELEERGEGTTLLTAARIRALVVLNRRMEALNVIDTASPDEAAAFWFTATRGAILADYGQHQEALDAVQSILESDQTDPRANYLAGYCLRRMDEPEAAAGHLRTALDWAPGDASFAAELGDALCTAHQTDQGRTAYEEGVSRMDRLPSWDIPGLAATAWCLARLGRTEEAVDRAQQALLADPQSSSHTSPRASSSSWPTVPTWRSRRPRRPRRSSTRWATSGWVRHGWPTQCVPSATLSSTAPCHVTWH